MTDTAAITKTIIHPQWYAPMEYHILDKAETDRTSQTTRLQYTSYYNKSAYDTGGMYMTSTIIRLKEAVFADALDLSLYIVAQEDNVLSGGTVDEIVSDDAPEEPI